MSGTYEIVCLACGETLDLGKIIRFEESGREVPWQFGGVRDLLDHSWRSGATLFELVERFLILHRAHPVSILSEYALDELDPDFRRSSFDGAQDLMSREISPTPDPSRDENQLSDECIREFRDALGYD